MHEIICPHCGKAFKIDEAEDLTVKRLTRGNPTMAAKFAELKHQDNSDAE